MPKISELTTITDEQLTDKDVLPIVDKNEAGDIIFDTKSVRIDQLRKIKALDVTLANIASNSVSVAGPTFAVTTDGKIVFLPSGSTAPADNANWDTQWLDPATGKIKEDLFPDLVILGLRQGTRAELDAADPALEVNEPAWETDTQVFRVGSVRFVPPAGLDTVATNKAKLALTDVSYGAEYLITGEANRLEKYLGDLGDANAGFTVSGSPEGDYPLNGNYSPTEKFNNGKRRYLITNSVYHRLVYYSAGGWVMQGDLSNYYSAAGNEDYPWEADWSGTPITVTKNPIAGDKNWEILGPNTYELLAYTYEMYADDEINGVSGFGSGTVTSLGWVKESQLIPALSPTAGTILFQPSNSNNKVSTNGVDFESFNTSFMSLILSVSAYNQYNIAGEYFLAPSFAPSRGALQLAFTGMNI